MIWSRDSLSKESLSRLESLCKRVLLSSAVLTCSLLEVLKKITVYVVMFNIPNIYPYNMISFEIYSYPNSL